MSSMEVWARFTQEGWHRWPDASARRDYLAHEHRHLFHVCVTVPVTHEDRQVEFHDLMDAARSAWPGPALGPMSCETIARIIGAHVLQEFALDVVRVTVSEDDECGANLTITSEEQS